MARHLARLKLSLEKGLSLKALCRSGGGCSWMGGARAAVTVDVLFT